MRARRWIPVAIGVALLLAVAAVLAVRAFVADVRGPEPDPAPTYAEGVLTPQEQTVTVTAGSDGSIAVSVRLVFDAGPGTDRPVTWVTGPVQLGWAGDDRRVQYWAQPSVAGLSGQVIDPDRPAEPLTLTSTRPERADPFLDPTTYRFTPAAPWAAGRHRVQIDYRLHDVYVEADGPAVLVVPLGFPSGPLSDQLRDVTRIQVAGAPVLDCPATNTSFGERRRCAGAAGAQVYRTRAAAVDQVESLVFRPTGVDAAPVPVPQREVR